MVPRERAGRRGEATECAPERVEDVVQSDGLRGREERARVDENLREQNGVQLRPQLLAGADVHDLVGARVQHDDAVVALGRASCKPILPVFLHQIVRESGRETEQLLLRVAFPVIFDKLKPIVFVLYLEFNQITVVNLFSVHYIPVLCIRDVPYSTV